MSGMHPPNRYGGRHARGDDPTYGVGPGYEPDEPPAWRSGRSEYGESGYASSADGGYPGYGQTSGYGAGTGYGATGYGETGCSAAPGYRPAFGHEADAYGASSAHSPRRSTAYGPADGYPPAPGEYGDYAGGYRSDGDGTGRHTYRADHGYGADHPGSGYPSTYPGSDHPPKPGRPTYAGYPQPSAYTERPGYTEPTGYAGQAGYSPAGEYPQPEYQTPPQTRGRATATLPAPAARRGTRPGEPPGRASAPGRGRGRRALVGASVVLSVLALCALVGWLIARPYLAQWPATLSKPQQLSGLELSGEPALQQKADEIASGLRGDVKDDNALAAFYHDPDDERKLVALIGGTAFLASPKAQLDDTFRGVNTAEMPIGEVRDVDAGPLGGLARCASAQLRPAGEQDQPPAGQAEGDQTPGDQATASQPEGEQADDGAMPLTICAWADHGSWVIGLFFNRPLDESAELLRTIRGEILKR